MTLFFFNHEIENPVLQAIVAIGAVVFAVAVVALAMAIILPVVGVALTGALLITGIVLVILLITVPFISFFGILFSNRKKGSGVQESRTVDVDTFHAVKVSGAVKIDIVCGEPQSLTVTTDDNLLDSVQTTVKDGELSISFARSISSTLGIGIQIAMADLKKIRMYGATRATSTGVDSDELLIRGSGASKVTARGNCRRAEVRFSGAGNIEAKDLISEKVKVKLAGSARAVLHATEEVTVRISGAGRVVCHGNPPEVRKHISGSGKVEIVE